MVYVPLVVQHVSVFLLYFCGATLFTCSVYDSTGRTTCDGRQCDMIGIRVYYVCDDSSILPTMTFIVCVPLFFSAFLYLDVAHVCVL